MVDIPGNSTTTSTISLGGSVSDSLEAVGDHDWYRITLTAGQQISVFVDGLTLPDPIVRIRDANGNILYTGDDWGDGLDAFVGFAATYTGTYFVDVGSAPETQTGSYSVHVTTYTPPPLGTVDDIANQLTNGYWNGDSHHFAVTQGGSITVNLTGIDPSGAAVARQALALWTDIIGVTFLEVQTGGQIVFGQANEGTGAFSTAEWAGGITSSATVNVAPSRLNLHTYLHEIAHALGLGHAGDYNGGTAFSRYPYEAMWANDGAALSIMSYFDNGENSYYAGLGFTNTNIVSPQLADIIAMGNLYGLSTTTRTGDTVYGFNSNSGRDVFNANLNPNVAYTIFDSGGNDTLDYSGFAASQLINLNAEAFSNVGLGVGNVSIARGVVIENAIGGSGNDTLIGNAADNILTGGAGTNILTGGAGSDTFRDTLANLNGDTITDFSVGDRILFTNASLSGFTFTLSGSTLTYSGGSLTLAGASGTLVASAAAEGGVQLRLAPVAPSSMLADYDGDGRADLAWRHSDGTIMDWLGEADGGFADNYGQAVWLDAGWRMLASGDFDGDGRDDLLLRHDNGLIMDWLGKVGGGFINNYAHAAFVDGNWSAIAIGDVNGDGRDDVVLRHAGGMIMDLLGQADGGFANNYANAAWLNASWQLIGSGDFDHDGRQDLLFRHESGLVLDLLGRDNGGFANNYANAGWLNGSWQAIGTGDVDGDGRDDIIWRNSDGTIMTWLGQANGGFANNYANAGWLSNSWRLLGVADLDGDGRSDLLLRHDSGLFMSWTGQASGGFVNNYAQAEYLDAGWTLLGTGDVNGDGRDDIAWRNVNGMVMDWLGDSDGGFTNNYAQAGWLNPSWQVQPSEGLF